MHNWFECKVRYDKTLDTGMIKTVTEPYLVDEEILGEAIFRSNLFARIDEKSL